MTILNNSIDAQQYWYFLCHIGFIQITHIAAKYDLLLFLTYLICTII